MVTDINLTPGGGPPTVENCDFSGGYGLSLSLIYTAPPVATVWHFKESRKMRSHAITLLAG